MAKTSKVRENLQAAFTDLESGEIGRDLYGEYLRGQKKKFPEQFAEIQGQNTEKTNRLLNMIQMGDNLDWIKDPISKRGMEDAEFSTAIPFGSENSMINVYGRAGNQDVYGLTKQLPGGEYQSYVRGNVLPDTLRHERFHVGAKGQGVPNEEYVNRGIDQAYAEKMGYSDPSAMDFLSNMTRTREDTSYMQDYINKYVK